MLRFAVRRLLLLIPILLGLSVLVFLFVRALPGGPEQALLGERATPERIAEVRETFGLNRPVHEQYLSYMGKVAQGENRVFAYLQSQCQYRRKSSTD